MTDAGLRRAARHWDSNPWNTPAVTFWLQLKSVQRRLAIKESGRPDSNWVDHTLADPLCGLPAAALA